MLNALINTAVDGIVVIDDSGIVQVFNPACTRLFGYSPDEVIGQNVRMLMPSHYRDEHDDYLENYLRSGDRKIIGLGREVAGQRKNGSTFPMDLSVGEALVEGRRTFVGIVRDISERKAAELELTQSNAKLQTALQDLTTAQNLLVQSEKLAGLGELSAGISHELNTPIGVAVTASSHLRSVTNDIKHQFEQETLSADELEKYLDNSEEIAHIILNNMQRAAELVRNFKSMSADQIEHSRRQFNLKEVLEEVIVSLRPNLRRTRIRVAIQCPSDIHMQSFPGAISQIMTNLIMNALKHAFTDDEPGNIQIHVSQSDGIVVITHRDNGRGIDSTLLGRIFEPFVSSRRTSDGTGLGLYIVHSLVTTTLRGDIQVRNSETQGASFTLSIPADVHANDI